MKTYLISSLLLTLVSCALFYRIEDSSFKYDPITESKSSGSPVQIFWIGHASFLIKIYDRWIATDPNFSERIGLIVKRFVEAGIRTDKLPAINYILISHTHFDHLDQPTLRQLKGSENLLVPKGGVTYIPDGLFKKVIGVQNWKSFQDGDFTITAVPVRHFGGRWLIDNLWDGDPYTAYIIQYKDITIYFAGDTGYDENIFKEIGNKFSVDIALVPIGPVGLTTSLFPLGNSVHVNPFGAVEIFKDVRAKVMIPMHHSTFYRRGGKEEEMLLRQLKNRDSKKKFIFLISVRRLNLKKTGKI